MEQTDPDERPLFTLMDESETGIKFVNQVEYTENYNTYTYRNYYNGGGVGIGDFNNDGLADIYFCGNLVDNRLYLNKGNFVFEDITRSAGVACEGVWSTGVSIADVNGDGWLDIYVCKSGDPRGEFRFNQLFINNQDLTFTDRAREYGIADKGLSTHAAFFDYDRDGDLDCYLMNNSIRSVGGYKMIKDQRKIRDPEGGNKLYRNDGAVFTDVSEQAGIYGSFIGFGLGVTIGDLNSDGWPDIFISNDFFERDYLYLNNQDGTFTEVIEDQLRELTLGSMGADIGDINNDGFPEIFVTEMLPYDEARLKTKSMFETWEKYLFNIENGYYRQFSRNVLQLNNGNGTFSEIGRLAGVEATDWSWGALFADFDNDGWKDIFVANGIYKDLLDQDYLNFYSNPEVVRSMIRMEEGAILKLIDAIPSQALSNYLFQNNHDLTFTNKARDWGLNTLSFSNGAAYGDLDNDGDLDLVVNNVNMPSFIYRNEGVDGHNYLKIKIKGAGRNTRGVGTILSVYAGDETLYYEQNPMKGYQSTVNDCIIVGLGNTESIDSIMINWPSGGHSVIKGITVNSTLELDENVLDKLPDLFQRSSSPKIFEDVTEQIGIKYLHIENEYTDFKEDPLLYHMRSVSGPKIAVGDINNDGLDDLYVSGSQNQAGVLFVQSEKGKFNPTEQPAFTGDRFSEDTDCAFFFANDDEYLDLYVTSGGTEFPSDVFPLKDRLYFNDGNGTFTYSNQSLPTSRGQSSSCVEPADFDNDGDIDLFVGTRLRLDMYGVAVNGYLLHNDGNGKFTNVTNSIAPALSGVGMITDAAWADIDNDNDLDLCIVGEWMPVRMFVNTEGTFIEKKELFDVKSSGWWNSIQADDLDNDGDSDFVLGNHGLNSRFSASQEYPITLFISDFDLNGTPEQIICTYRDNQLYPFVQRENLVNQLPGLRKHYEKSVQYKLQTIQDIFDEGQLQNALKLESYFMENAIMINDGTGDFMLRPLPLEAQITPVYGILIDDFDSNGLKDIIFTGNFYHSKPEAGIYDAGYGIFLTQDTPGVYNSKLARESGLLSKGAKRDVKKIVINGYEHIVIAKNNDALQLFKINELEIKNK